MSKLVWGVGENDLGYRVQVNEELPKNGGKKSGRLFLNAHIMQRGQEC